MSARPASCQSARIASNRDDSALGDSADGTLIGADYAQDMYPRFNLFSTDFIEAKKTWVSSWVAEAQSWMDDDSADVEAFVFGSMPKDMQGRADAVLWSGGNLFVVLSKGAR